MKNHLDQAMMIRSATRGGFVRCNNAFRQATGANEAQLSERPLLEWIALSDRAEVQAALQRGDSVCHVAHLTNSHTPIPLQLHVRRAGGETMVLAHTVDEDVPVSDGGSPPAESKEQEVLDTIARIVEEQNPGYLCSILLLQDGRFVKGAGPSLPADYNDAIDGFAVGPTVGSCGTAIYWNVPVIVEDIQADPLWIPFAELAARAGVAACWSHPFTSSNGRVLGAIALYSREPRAPSPEQLSTLRATARMTGLAVERGRAEDVLRAQRVRERELEERLRQAEKFEALGVLAGGVAHDFNNVLFAIQSNAEFVLEGLAPDSEEASCLRDITRTAQRAAGFCRQMLDYAGRGVYNPTSFDIRDLVPQVRPLAKAVLSGRAKLRFELPNSPIFIDGDENQLLRVLLNFVTNAAEATSTRGGEIVVAAKIVNLGGEELHRLPPPAAFAKGEFCQLTVEDDGCGMDELTASRIFDPFFSKSSSGRGLGLAATKGIIARHGGALSLRTAPNEGSTFTVLLPLSAAGPPERPEAQTARRGARPIRLLLAEDDDNLRNALLRHLRRREFEVTEARNGQEAIDLFEASPEAFDCALLDYMMPRRTGREVRASMERIRPDLPVLIMTGMASDAVKAGLETKERTVVLQKPIVIAELLAAIAAATNPEGR